MAIGTAAAIGLGVAGIGSALGASSANKASRRAAQTSADTNAANIALARESRDMSLQRLDPYNFRGNVAGNQINALLGLGGSGQVPGGANALATGIMPANVPGERPVGPSPQEAAFDTFRNSTGFQFRRDEGMDAVRSAYAGIGGLQSGAAMRGIAEYGQNFASNEFANYLNALGAQQAVGAGAASAGAGVTQNFAGTVIDSNNFNAQNQMAAQLSRQNVFGNMLGTVGGGVLGYLGGRG